MTTSARWLRYMAVSAGVVVVLGTLIVLVFGREVVAAVATAGAIGLVVQALAAVLLFMFGPGSSQPANFVVGWASGALLRMMAVLATGLWLTRTNAVAEAPALLSMVLFLFVLTLIEPLFLKTAT